MNPASIHTLCYRRVLSNAGRLLDYGCGTGDNVRQLIRDGYPREHITASDINRASIDLGFDLYRDNADIDDIFTASETFPFGVAAFDLVYSALFYMLLTMIPYYGVPGQRLYHSRGRRCVLWVHIRC